MPRAIKLVRSLIARFRIGHLESGHRSPRTSLIDGCGNRSFRAIPHVTIEGVSTV